MSLVPMIIDGKLLMGPAGLSADFTPYLGMAESPCPYTPRSTRKVTGGARSTMTPTASGVRFTSKGALSWFGGGCDYLMAYEGTGDMSATLSTNVTLDNDMTLSAQIFTCVKAHSYAQEYRWYPALEMEYDEAAGWTLGPTVTVPVRWARWYWILTASISKSYGYFAAGDYIDLNIS